MKKLTIALLALCFTMPTSPAFAQQGNALALLSYSLQAQATNGTVPLTPFRGSTAFTPGAAIKAEGRNWHEGTQGYADPLGLQNRFVITAQPSGIAYHPVQVEPNRLWFFLPWVTPATTSITISLRDPFNAVVDGGPIVWTEVIPLTVVRAAPVLTNAGQWYSFTDARLHEFSGSFILPRNGLRFDLALFAANVGSVPLWVVKVEQNSEVVFEVLAFMDYANQARRQDNLQFQMPQLPTGIYAVSIYALDDPALVSPSITLTIQ